MQLLQQTRKTSQQNPFAHHERSVKVSDDVSWQDKIGSNQFDNLAVAAETLHAQS